MTARVQCHACNETPEVCDDDWTGRGYGCCRRCDISHGNLHMPDACHRHLEPGGVCGICGVATPGAG